MQKPLAHGPVGDKLLLSDAVDRTKERCSTR
jgi:hypothetical protein